MITTSRTLNSGAATGGAGVATANATGAELLIGELIGIWTEYLDAPPATTDVTIELIAAVDGVPDVTILTLTNANTDGFFPVRQQAVDDAGAGITGAYDRIGLFHYLKVTIAQANDDDNVSVTCLYDRGN